MRKLLLTTLILLCLPLAAVARECFWQPGGGSGTACTDPDIGGTACTLATAQSECTTAGDTYTALNGTETITGTIFIDIDNAHFRTKNRHQAVIEMTGTNNVPIISTCGGDGGSFCGAHSGNDGTTIEGFHFKCHDYISTTSMYNQRKISHQESDDNTYIYNILEECAFGQAANVFDSLRPTYRYNLIFGSGAEATYFKQTNESTIISNGIFEYNILYNNARADGSPDWGGAMLDLNSSSGWSIKWNIFADRTVGSGRESALNFNNTRTVDFSRNIVANITNNAFSFINYLSTDANNSLQNNVFKDITVESGGRIIWWRNEGYGLGATVVSNNDFCDAPDNICEKNISCSTTAPISQSDLSVPSQDGLPGDAADSICDTTIDTILQEAADAGAEIGGLPTPQLSVGEVGSIDGTTLILDLAVTNWPLGATLDDIIACDDTRLTVTGSTSGAISTTGCVVVDADTVDVTLASEPVAGETITVQALSRFVQMDTSFGEVAADGGIDLYSIAGASIEATNNLVSAAQPKIDSGTSISSGVALQ